MKREIDDRTYLKYLFQSLNVNDLKQICRDFNIKGYSRLKKSELIDFILDSLAEEEYEEILKQKELEIISQGINLAIKKVNGEDRETISEIRIVNPDNHEIEIDFKGWNWEVGSYLSITPENIKNPERDCDCRIGANMGFCSHFWIGFILSLKEGYFNLKDWTLTQLPNDFEEVIEPIKLSTAGIGEKTAKEAEMVSLVDESTESGLLMKFIDASVTIYEGEITEILEKKSEFQEYVNTFYLITLKNVKLGPRITRKSDFHEEDIEDIEKLKIRISENLEEKSNLKVGDHIKVNGKLDKDSFLGIVVKNIRKVEKI